MSALTILFFAAALFGPGSLLAMAQATNEQASHSIKPNDEIQTVSFCELLDHPQLYFDKPIRLTATYQPGIEGSTLYDVRCVRSPNNRIGVSWMKLADDQSKIRNQEFEMIRSRRAGDRPRVTVTGILRNSSRRDFQSYRYRFDIIHLEEMREDIAETIITFSGELRSGRTYRAAVRGDQAFGLAFMSPLRTPIHQAVRLEWTNFKQFRVLRRLGDRKQRQIVLLVVADDIQQISAQRWNRTLRLEILLVE